MIDIDAFTAIVEQVVGGVPDTYLRGLNGGVLVLEGAREHDGGPPGTLVLGEYVVRPWLGAHIALYYDSFRTLFPGMGREQLRERIRHTILHELRHHVETRAGVDDLVRRDDEAIRNLWRRHDGSVDGG